MLAQARVVRDASFIGMKAYSRGTHVFTNCVVSIYVKGDHTWKENYYLSIVNSKKKIERHMTESVRCASYECDYAEI